MDNEKKEWSTPKVEQLVVANTESGIVSGLESSGSVGFVTPS